MSEPQEMILLEKHDLVGVVAQLFAEGYRLVQIGCSTLPAAYELNYSFDKDYRFKNLRITAAPGEEVPSISVIYPNAFLYENEIHDLFGVARQEHHHRLRRHSLPNGDQDALQHGECKVSRTSEGKGRCSVKGPGKIKEPPESPPGQKE